MQSKDWLPLMQRLQPFARAGETNSTAHVLPMWGRQAPAAVPPTILPSAGESGSTGAPAHAAAGNDIVATAAAILDEEMAKGILGAHQIAPSSPATLAPSAPSGAPGEWHDLLARITALQPLLEHLRPVPAATDTGTGQSLPALRPAAGRAGQRASTSMALRNHTAERLAVRLAATDLLSSVARLPHDVVEFSPAELMLEPGAEQAVQIHTAVPPNTRPGRYTALVVASGAEETRALLTVDVGP